MSSASSCGSQCTAASLNLKLIQLRTKINVILRLDAGLTISAGSKTKSAIGGVFFRAGAHLIHRTTAIKNITKSRLLICNFFEGTTASLSVCIPRKCDIQAVITGGGGAAVKNRTKSCSINDFLLHRKL
jgi:hypothetical protein